MVAEVLAQVPGNARLLIDGTLGTGGHAEALLNKLGSEVRLIGFDIDTEALKIAENRLRPFKQRVQMIHDSYAAFDKHLDLSQKGRIDFFLLDLGISSHQLESSGRGFSFRDQSEPLDLRFDASRGHAVSERLKQTDVGELTDVLARYGEILRPRRVAAAIVAAARAGNLETVGELVSVLSKFSGRGRRTQFQAQVWQALRIWHNEELVQLESVLPKIVEHLAPGGVVTVISFHSLEDRLVKQYFAGEENPCICPRDIPVCVCGHKATLERTLRRALKPTAAEIAANPRSRSARLRGARKLSV